MLENQTVFELCLRKHINRVVMCVCYRTNLNVYGGGHLRGDPKMLFCGGIRIV
jgi:hypothetical protein